jgi:hypothetical protein
MRLTYTTRVYSWYLQVGVMKKQAYYSWFVGKPGPGGLLQHLPSVEETAALLAAEAGAERTSLSLPPLLHSHNQLTSTLVSAWYCSASEHVKNYGNRSGESAASSSGPSRKESRATHDDDAEATRRTGLTDDEDEEMSMRGSNKGAAAETVSFAGVGAEGKHLRDKAAEFWHLLKLVTATIKQSMLALLNLVWQILLHESHKYAFTHSLSLSLIAR